MLEPLDQLEQLRRAAGVVPQAEPVRVGPVGADDRRSAFERALDWFRQRKASHERQRNEAPVEDDQELWRRLMRRCGRV